MLPGYAAFEEALAAFAGRDAVVQALRPIATNKADVEGWSTLMHRRGYTVGVRLEIKPAGKFACTWANS